MPMRNFRMLMGNQRNFVFTNADIICRNIYMYISISSPNDPIIVKLKCSVYIFKSANFFI